MTKDTTKEAAVAAEGLLFDDWFDGIEDGVRARVRGFIETMLEAELSEAWSRPRDGRRRLGEDEATPSVVGVRHGHRERTLTGTFGKTRIAVPRARLTGEDGKTREWRSGSLRAYQRRTLAADALIAGAYLAGTNTRRVRRALNAVFAGPVGKDVVSRVWRKTKSDWHAWNARSLAEEPIVRLILDGTVARVRLDRKATSISLLVGLGVRADGQKMLLAIKSMGGESEAAWRALLDDLIRRGLRTPELVVVDGAPGVEKALAALWPDMAVQRCTVHKHRNLLAHAPERLHEEISDDYRDMIYAATRGEVETRRKLAGALRSFDFCEVGCAHHSEQPIGFGLRVPTNPLRIVLQYIGERRVPRGRRWKAPPNPGFLRLTRKLSIRCDDCGRMPLLDDLIRDKLVADGRGLVDRHDEKTRS